MSSFTAQEITLLQVAARVLRALPVYNTTTSKELRRTIRDGMKGDLQTASQMLIGPGGDQIRVHRIIAIASRSIQKRDKKFLPQFWTSEDTELWRESDLERQGRVLHNLPAGLDLGDNRYWETDSLPSKDPAGFTPAPARATAAPPSAPASPSQRVYTSESVPPLKSALKRPAVPQNAEPGPSRTQRSTWDIPPTPILVPGGVGVHTTSRGRPLTSGAEMGGGRGRSPLRKAPAAVTAPGQSSGQEPVAGHPVRRSSRPRSTSRGPGKASSSQPPLGEETHPSTTTNAKRRGRKPTHKLIPTPPPPPPCPFDLDTDRPLSRADLSLWRGRHVAPLACTTCEKTGDECEWDLMSHANCIPCHTKKRGCSLAPKYTSGSGASSGLAKRFILALFWERQQRLSEGVELTEDDRRGPVIVPKLEGSHQKSAGKRKRDVTDAEDNDEEDEHDGRTPAPRGKHRRSTTAGSRTVAAPNRNKGKGRARTPSPPESEDEPARLPEDFHQKGGSKQAAVRKVGPPQKKKRSHSRPAAPRQLQCYVDIPPMAPIFRTSRGPTLQTSVTVAPIRYQRMVYSPSVTSPSPPPNDAPAAGEDEQMHSPSLHTPGTPQAVTSPVAGPLGSPCHLRSPPHNLSPPEIFRGTPMRDITPPPQQSPPRSPSRAVTPPRDVSPPPTPIHTPVVRGSPRDRRIDPADEIHRHLATGRRSLLTGRAPPARSPEASGESEMQAMERRLHALEQEVESQRRYGVQLLSQLQMERTTFEHRLNILEQRTAHLPPRRSASPPQPDIPQFHDRAPNAAPSVIHIPAVVFEELASSMPIRPSSGGQRRNLRTIGSSSQAGSLPQPSGAAAITSPSPITGLAARMHRAPSPQLSMTPSLPLSQSAVAGRRLRPMDNGKIPSAPSAGVATSTGTSVATTIPSAPTTGASTSTTPGLPAAAQGVSLGVSALDLEDEAMLCDQFYRAFRNTGRDGPSDRMDVD
ncbi:hypothetical protein BXZ70DRAFT_911136 [Cristinia sonorae]|uniref:Uncharacterized protein n=1 Tax=Cristinia sonorae TaxID=1940300 RepID=A0A8K0UEZ0_9AGAR|nr:hypothetical protein BXZ70DRAFT_911136 [Cristinia sonorae]